MTTPPAPPALTLSDRRIEVALPQFAEWTGQAWFPHLGDHGMNAQASDLFVMSLGLGGEVGEVQEELVEGKPAGIRKELGDVAYYWGRLAGFYDLDVNALVVEAKATQISSQDRYQVALRLGQWTGRTQDVIKKSVRDDGLDRKALEGGMAQILAFWMETARLHELDCVDILQASIDKIVNRHAAGQLRGSDSPEGRKSPKTAR